MTQILISSSVLIIIVLLARALLKNRVSRRLQYALWLLVALRLLIPMEFGQSQYSVATLTQQAERSQPIQQIQSTLQEPVVGPSRTELYEQLLNEYLQQSTAPEVQEPPQVQIQEQLQTQVQEQITAPTLAEVLTAIWIGGIAVMAIWFLTTNLLFLHRAKRGAVPCPEVEEAVPVRISGSVPTPCLVGLIRPVIYLTPASVEDPRSRAHVLTHELTHLRHLDHIWSWIRCICLCIYWFDPLVWIAAILSKRDCELACDESALKKLGDAERIAYGKTLLDTVTQSRSPAHILETATAMNETKKQLKERVSYIVKKPKNLLIAAISLILVAALAAGCAFMGGKATGPTTSPTFTDPTETTATTPSNVTDPNVETEPSDTTEPTGDPELIEPVDAVTLFEDPDGWYIMALTSIYSDPQQLDIAAFFSRGFPDGSNVPTDQEWELLKDVAGFERNDRFRRLPKEKMDEILTMVFGIGLHQMDGIGLDRLTYLPQTQCYYFMASVDPSTPEIYLDHTVSSPTYVEYIDSSGHRHYIDLSVTWNGSSYDYNIRSHWMDEVNRLANTMTLAKEQLGLSYCEFLYISEQIIQQHLAQQGYTDPETSAEVARDTMAMYERSLYLREDTLMLRFRYLSHAYQNIPLHRAYTIEFHPKAWILKDDLEGSSYRWLFDLEAQTDGAYADSYYIILTDALFSDPKAFVEQLSQRPQEQIEHIAEYLPYHFNDEVYDVYLALLDQLRLSGDMTEAEQDTVLWLRNTFLAFVYDDPEYAPGVPEEAAVLIDKYTLYRAVGLCCDYEYVAKDMSQYLTEEQKQGYYKVQYRITCCHTPSEVKAHIRSYLDDSLIDRWPDELLFTDDASELYLIVVPTGIVTYRNVVPTTLVPYRNGELVEQTYSKIVVNAGAYNENGYIRSVAFTMESTGDSFKLCRVAELDPDVSTTKYYHHGLWFRLDSSFTAGTDPDLPERFTFQNGLIEGAIQYGTLEDLTGESDLTSKDYAWQQLRQYGGDYEDGGIGDLEDRVYYTVLKGEEITEVRCLYVRGDMGWLCQIQCDTDQGRLAQMIDIITSGLSS